MSNLQNQTNLLFSANISINHLKTPSTQQIIDPADMVNQSLLSSDTLKELHHELETLRQTNDLLREEKKNLH